MAEFKIYSSSAGSGKTFTLTREYLRLILQKEDPRAFRHILAITFTNDAAGEMKNRIMSALREIGSDSPVPGKYAAMLAAIGQDLPDVPPEVLRQRARAAFHAILHDYADFGVKTIDSFINQLVSSFTLDLDLPYNYEIQLDKDIVLHEAAERLLAKVGLKEFEELSDMLTEFALSKAEDGKSWNNLVADLVKFAYPLLDDHSFYLIAENEALQSSDFLIIKKNIRDYRKELFESIARLGEEGMNLITGNGLSAADFTQGERGIYGFYLKLSRNPELLFENGFPNTYQKGALEEDKWYPKAASAGTRSIIDLLKDDLRRIAGEILKIREAHVARFILLGEIEKVLSQLSLLTYIKEEFDLVLAEKNQVFLSEFNRKILNIVVSEPVPFIYERIGEKYDHLLIDEFQDTSDLQFFNLLPLIENSLAKSNFNMIVGDPKQSIYRWRGGKVELMIHLIKGQAERLGKNELVSEIQQGQLEVLNSFIQKEALGVNFRSRKEIVAFNNALFESIKQEKQDTYPFMADVFEDYRQASRPDAGEGGHVEIEFLVASGDKEPAWDRIKEIVEQMLSEGYKLGDIAVLSRTNRQSAGVAEFLDGLGYKIVSKDSLLLSNCLSVNLLAAFLGLISDPGNELRRYEAVFLFFLHRSGATPAGGLYEEIGKYTRQKSTGDFLKFFESYGVQFAGSEFDFLNLYALTESLIESLGLMKIRKDIPYLLSFLDLVLGFYQQESNQLQDFLNHWEEVKSKRSIHTEAGEEAITVTTIHKSKGLEYPVVIMPYTDWTYKPKPGTTVWMKLPEEPLEELQVQGNRLKTAPFVLKEALNSTALAEEYRKEQEMTFIESLNMLYVGLTRPTDRLFLMSALSIAEKPTGVGEFFMSFLEKTGEYQPGKYRYVLSEGNGTVPGKEGGPDREVIAVGTLKTASRLKKMRIRSDASRLFDMETFSKQREWGNKIHAGFALIRSKADVDEAVRRLLIEGMITEAEKEPVREELKNVLQHPAISFLFEEGLEIENERGILLKGHDIQRPDRVVFKGDTIYIVDYKTGDRKASHQHQLRNYGELFARMGHHKQVMMLIYLDPFHVEEIKPVLGQLSLF